MRLTLQESQRGEKCDVNNGVVDPNQCFGSGLDPDSIRPVNPYPDPDRNPDPDPVGQK